VGIKLETRDLLLAVQHGTISRAGLVSWLEDLRVPSAGRFRVPVYQGPTWAEHGQISLLIAQLESIVGDPRFATRH
jgi:hypothetical protein